MLFKYCSLAEVKYFCENLKTQPIHGVHHGINPPQKHHLPLSCQAPFKLANCPRGILEKFGDVLAKKKVTLSWLMNSNMVKPEEFDHLHLVYHFTVPLRTNVWVSYFMHKLIIIKTFHHPWFCYCKLSAKDYPHSKRRGDLKISRWSLYSQCI